MGKVTSPKSRAEAILGTLLRKRPEKASQNKWLKLLPSHDFFGMGVAPRQILRHLVTAAMKPIRETYRKAGDQVSVAEHAAQDTLAEEQLLMFRAVAGQTPRES
jgi:hypothetical protein